MIKQTSSGTILNIESVSPNTTSYLQARSSGATETITLGLPMNGIQTVAIGGTVTANDVLTITVHDAELAGGQQAVNYTVQSGDTLSDIASGLAAAINANANLQAIGVTATSVSTVVNVNSSSVNLTTYSQSTSPRATETISLGISTGVSQYAYNNVNELTGIAAGGATRFQGTTNKAVKSVTINTAPSTLNWSQNFTGNPELNSGDNNAAVVAIDGGNNQVTNNYRVSVKGAANKTLTYDLDGNLTNDGTNTYEWDAENRLIEIDYPGSGNNSQFTYDGLGQITKIVERENNITTNTKQFVWYDDNKCEERDSKGVMTKQFFSLGQASNGTNYFYTTDHVGSSFIVNVGDFSQLAPMMGALKAFNAGVSTGSVREMTNVAGNIQAQYRYDSFGRVIKLQGAQGSDFQYADYYLHLRSGLSLTLRRFYQSNLGRWINRDPIEEEGGINLYAYVENNPVSFFDPLGLKKKQCKKKPGKGKSQGGQPKVPSTSRPESHSPASGKGSTPTPPKWTELQCPEWHDPVNDWIRAREKMKMLGLPEPILPIPPGWPGNQNPPPLEPWDLHLPPNRYPGSPPWDPTATKPFRGMS